MLSHTPYRRCNCRRELVLIAGPATAQVPAGIDAVKAANTSF
jgi:hypothetical protein